MLKETVLFAIKAAIVITMLMGAAFLLDLWGVIDFGRYSSKAELKSEQEKLEGAGEAQEAIAAIMAAAKIYHAETGKWATQISQLEKLHLEPATKDRWRFSITPGANGLRSIRAISKAPMPGGAGKVVILDVERGTWSGYGFDY